MMMKMKMMMIMMMVMVMLLMMILLLLKMMIMGSGAFGKMGPKLHEKSALHIMMHASPLDCFFGKLAVEGIN